LAKNTFFNIKAGSQRRPPPKKRKKLFNFSINYNAPSDLTKARYDRNVTETIWKTASDNVQRSYLYDYDALGRTTGATNGNSDYNLGLVQYDKNGNIQKLKRNGHTNTNASTFGLMDDLTYSYVGNQLKAIDDASSASAVTGFIEGADNTAEYGFDMNGNMVRDDNKKITAIEYNHLNMPTKVTVTGTNAGTLDYVYAADRTKLRKINSNGTTTDYIGNYVYEGNTLKQITQPEGYIEPDGDGWQYVYRYVDIWGNTRLTYADDNNDGSIDPSIEIRREQNYYPFGLEHKGYNNVSYGAKNNLKTYQGQEFTEDLGLNVHEWKFRMSDPAIGRFWQIDPLAQDYVYNSTYAFQENKLGMGVELEGAELLDRLNAGIKQAKQGISNLFNNETSKELNRRIESAKTEDPGRKEEIQQERLADRSQAMGDIAEGTAEATKGGSQVVGTVMEEGGSGIAIVSAAAGFAPGVAAGEGISKTGAAINITVDLVDGKSLGDIARERAPGVILGQLGKKAFRAAKKARVDSDALKSGLKVMEKGAEEMIQDMMSKENKGVTPLNIPVASPVIGPPIEEN